MSVGETPITIVGNLTDNPEVSFTPSGAQVARFTVASTPRTFDKTTNQWTDGTGMFLRCTAWRDLADHVGETLTKGMRVIVSGRLRQHNWQTKEGENRSMLQVEVDEIGPSLRFATAKVTKAQHNATTGSSWTATPTAASADPWATPAPAMAGGGSSDEPPF